MFRILAAMTVLSLGFSSGLSAEEDENVEARDSSAIGSRARIANASNRSSREQAAGSRAGTIG